MSLAQDLAYGHHVKITFLRDFAANIRFLVALPIFILAESKIDHRWRTLVLEFLRTGLIHEDQLPFFDAILTKIIRLRDSFLPEIILALLAYLPSILIHESELLMNGASNWHFLASGTASLSLAGWWFKLLSSPFFRFLMLRWLWRLVLWALFLWRVSRINLHLVATHTDLAAGLGFLSEGQIAFSSIVFAGSTVIASEVSNAIAYEGATLSSLKFIMIGYGVLAVTLLVLPLLVVAPSLSRSKRKPSSNSAASLPTTINSSKTNGFTDITSPTNISLATPRLLPSPISALVSLSFKTCPTFPSTNPLLSPSPSPLFFP